ncbi:hypothetical protein FQA39_LY01637 [Lamprigera yunnana]|nr:hypothetical protein FQA39_LY01637 [Lamprigera yunnana]
MGEDKVYNPIWPFYEPLYNFLKDVYECRSLINTEDNNVTVTPKLNLGLAAEVPVLKRRAKDPPELAEAGREMSNAFSTLNKVLNKKVATQDDECELYGRLLAIKLKKNPENEQEEIMLEIDNMIMNRRRNKQNKHNNSYPYTTRPGFSQSLDQSEWSYTCPSPHSRPPSADANRSTYTPYQAPPQRLQILSDKMVPVQIIQSGPSSNIQAQSYEAYNDSLQSQSSQFPNILYEAYTNA